MPKLRPIVTKFPPDFDFENVPSIDRGIISPCHGCKNNTPIITNSDDSANLVDRGVSWPCPKKVFYQMASQARNLNDPTYNYNHPVFDERLLASNPVWPGLNLKSPAGQPYLNKYTYVFVALFNDNVAPDSNPSWSSEGIRCRGPYLLASNERQWNFAGRIEQREPLLVFNTYYYLDGIEFLGYVFDAATLQVANGYTRKVSNNCSRFFSGQTN